MDAFTKFINGKIILDVKELVVLEMLIAIKTVSAVRYAKEHGLDPWRAVQVMIDEYYYPTEPTAYFVNQALDAIGWQEMKRI